jgi:hypothetical protein
MRELRDRELAHDRVVIDHEQANRLLEEVD